MVPPRTSCQGFPSIVNSSGRSEESTPSSTRRLQKRRCAASSSGLKVSQSRRVICSSGGRFLVIGDSSSRCIVSARVEKNPRVCSRSNRDSVNVVTCHLWCTTDTSISNGDLQPPSSGEKSTYRVLWRRISSEGPCLAKAYAMTSRSAA